MNPIETETTIQSKYKTQSKSESEVEVFSLDPIFFCNPA